MNGASDLVVYEGEIVEDSVNSELVTYETNKFEIAMNVQASDYPARAILDPAETYLSRLSPSSRVTATSYLNNIARIFNMNSFKECPWHTLNEIYVNHILTHLQKRKLSPSTIGGYLSVIKGVSFACYQAKTMHVESYTQINSIKKPRGSRLAKTGTLIDTDNFGVLIDVCSQDVSANGALRDIALLTLLRGCGLRRSEAVSLTLSQVNFSDMSLTVIGKRNKERRIWFNQRVKDALNDWLSVRSTRPSILASRGIMPQQMMAARDPFLFVGVHKSGTITETSGLTSTSVYRIMEKLQEKAGDRLSVRFSPHDIRRTYITGLLDAGFPLDEVQELAGHSNPMTTKIYDLNKSRNLKDIGIRMTF